MEICIALYIFWTCPPKETRPSMPRYTNGWQDSPEPLPGQTTPQLASRQSKICGDSEGGTSFQWSVKHVRRIAISIRTESTWVNLLATFKMQSISVYVLVDPNCLWRDHLENGTFRLETDESERLWRSVGRSQVGAAPILVQGRSCRPRGNSLSTTGFRKRRGKEVSTECWLDTKSFHVLLISLRFTYPGCTHTHFGWLRAPLLLVEPLVLADSLRPPIF